MVTPAAMRDAVAHAVESHTKQVDGMLLIDKATSLALEDRVRPTSLGNVTLQGVSAPTEIFSVQ
jgi:hypothetical protein